MTLPLSHDSTPPPVGFRIEWRWVPITEGDCREREGRLRGLLLAGALRLSRGERAGESDIRSADQPTAGSQSVAFVSFRPPGARTTNNGGQISKRKQTERQLC